MGIGLLDLSCAQYVQQGLFNQTPDNLKLMKVYDELNHRYGSDTLFIGAQGIEKKWAMRRKMLTPQYTTKWQDLPQIKC